MLNLASSQDDVIQSFRHIERLMAQACDRSSRPSDNVTLIAATKLVPALLIARVLKSGHRVFGENRVQEAKSKWPALRNLVEDIELHLIGPLQTNKAKEAVALFDVLQSVDREKLAEAIAVEVQRQGRCPKIFVQVNVGEEAQKSGIEFGAVETFVRACRVTHGLDVVGIMGIPPNGRPPGPYFDRLRSIAEHNGLRCISMGMSDDFEEAVARGASHVRIGRAIFGARPSNASSEATLALPDTEGGAT